MNTQPSRDGQPLDAEWLALPLSARGLVEELAKYVDDAGRLSAFLVEGADARAVGDELARLLCAHRGEYARVRRDAAVLLDRGFIAIEGTRICLVVDRGDAPPTLPSMPASTSTLEAPAKSTSAVRMRRLRALQKASRRDGLFPSHVTQVAVTSDARSDAGDASHVTRPLSLSQKKFNSEEERARARNGRRWVSRDAPFCERAREVAAGVGIREPDLVWRGFLARHAEKELSMDWDRLWETWVVREKKWERPQSGSRSGPSVKQAVDLDAPWLVAASGGSS